MKKTVTYLALLFLGASMAFAQSIKPTNTSPTNLEESQYFKNYDTDDGSDNDDDLLALPL